MYDREWWKNYNKSQERILYMKKYREANLERAKKYREENKERLRASALQRKIDSGWRPKTDWLYNRRVCYKCKRGNEPLIKWQYNKYKRQYYI